MDQLEIRKLTVGDIRKVARLHRECFPHDTDSYAESIDWIADNARQLRVRKARTYYVAELLKEHIGYILWEDDGGWRRPDQQVELKQVGVAAKYRGQGVGTKLVQESLKDYVQTVLQPSGRRLKLVKLSTGIENEAQKLYKKALGAVQELKECRIDDSYDGPEILMIARRDTLEEKLDISL
jgi:ribosomal protein S18 acetylase RimI-like enzyme